MTDYGATDTSTTPLTANQFPVSAVWVPGDALRAIGGATALTDGGGKHYTAAFMSQWATQSLSATLQNAATSTGAGTAFSLLGMGTVTFTVTGTFVATITFQLSEDGTNYKNISATTTAGTFTFPCSGMQKAQANITARSSGSITVTAHAVPLSTPGMITGYAPDSGPVYAQSDTPTNDSEGVPYAKLIVKSIAIDQFGSFIATIGQSSNPGYQVVTSGPSGPNLALGAVGEVNTSAGGNVTASVSSSTNVITRAGRLCNVLVTTANTTQTTIYDSNNSTTTGKTIIGIIPANPTVGTMYNFQFPVANGIYVSNGTSGVITVGYD